MCSVAALAPGLYRLEVKLDKFQSQVVTDIRLEVAQIAVQNIKLGIGGVAEELNVVAEAPVIESTTASVGQVIDRRTVRESRSTGATGDLGLLIPGSVAPQPATGFLTAPARPGDTLPSTPRATARTPSTSW